MTSITPLRLFIIGGHGRVALRVTSQALARGHTVFSQIRQKEHASDLPAKTTPIHVSLEDASVSSLADLFKQHDPHVILFLAGAGGKGGPERTTAVDELGAIKVFDAIEKSGLAERTDTFRRLLLCSAVDSRDIENTKPDWYGSEDFETSQRMRKVLGPYMEAKHKADANLAQRKTFPWFVLRPSTLADEAGTGKVSLGERKTISRPVPRDDVAATFVALAELPRGEGDGLMNDLTAGDVSVAEAVEGAVKRKRTDWLG